LAAARALHAAGWMVGSAAPGAGSFACRSRVVGLTHDIPTLESDPEPFVQAVRSAIQDGRYELVFGTTDDIVSVLSRRRAELETTLPYGPDRVVAHSMDKLELVLAAERAGLTVPRTVASDAAAMAAWRGPAIVKPRLHAALPIGTAWHQDAVICRDAQEIARRVAEIEAAGGSALLQELLVGQLDALTVVADRHGTIRARVQQRALRIWPLDVGVSAYAVTVPVDERLAFEAQNLITELGWFGLAQLQFLSDPAGRRRLIDFNGRFYGSLALALRAGVNLPAIWASLAMGGDPVDVRDAQPGVAYQWLSGDLRASLANGGSMADVLGACRAIPTSAHTLLNLRDPGPVVASIVPLIVRKLRG